MMLKSSSTNANSVDLQAIRRGPGVTESKIKVSQCRTGMSFGKCGLLSDTGGKETGFIITLAPMCIGVLGYPDLERDKVKVFYHHSSCNKQRPQ